jgi:prevent-host-death family protein
MIEVNVRELKSRLSHYLRKLEEGEEIKITRRGKTVGTIVPTPEDDRLRAKLEELESRGILRMSKGKLSPPRRRAKLIGEGPTISEMILEDRR